jgi:hypothetical protein
VHDAQGEREQAYEPEYDQQREHLGGSIHSPSGAGLGPGTVDQGWCGRRHSPSEMRCQAIRAPPGCLDRGCLALDRARQSPLGW